MHKMELNDQRLKKGAWDPEAPVLFGPDARPNFQVPLSLLSTAFTHISGPVVLYLIPPITCLPLANLDTPHFTQEP